MCHCTSHMPNPEKIMMKINNLCLNYWDVNNLYGWAMPQKLPLCCLKWIEEIFQFSKDFIKEYKELLDLHNDLPFLHERMKIEKLIANLHDRKEYVIHMRNLKKALNHLLVLKSA